MQTIVVAVLIVIAELIGALLACATSLINRARAANTTLRRIEEALLAMNRVKVIDSAIKSAGPVKRSQPADVGSAGFLTLRELKTMSGEGRRSVDSAPFANGRRPPRSSSQHRSTTNPHGAPECDVTAAVNNVDVVERGAAGAALESIDSAQSSTTFAKCDPGVEAVDITPTQERSEESESQNELEPSFAISWPMTNRQVPDTGLSVSADDIMVHGNQSLADAVAHTVPAANGELPIRKAAAILNLSPIQNGGNTVTGIGREALQYLSNLLLCIPIGRIAQPVA